MNGCNPFDLQAWHNQLMDVSTKVQLKYGAAPLGLLDQEALFWRAFTEAVRAHIAVKGNVSVRKMKRFALKAINLAIWVYVCSLELVHIFVVDLLFVFTVVIFI